LKLHFNWDTSAQIKALSPERYAEFVAQFPDIGLKPEYPKEGEYVYCSDIFATMEELEAITAYGVEPNVKKVKGLHYQNGIPAPASPANNITITNVHVPNAALFEVTKVNWLEDTCTENLQRQLDAGWRILAVCPSNDARRPDYILGMK
jgi:hypothetical protein